MASLIIIDHARGQAYETKHAGAKTPANIQQHNHQGEINESISETELLKDAPDINIFRAIQTAANGIGYHTRFTGYRQVMEEQAGKQAGRDQSE